MFPCGRLSKEAENVAWSSFSTPSSSPATMAKPTLIQSILGRPSQAYHFPQTKEYYSTKHEFVRAAAEAASESRPQSYLTAPDRESGYYSSTSTASASVYSEARSSSPLHWSREVRAQPYAPPLARCTR